MSFNIKKYNIPFPSPGPFRDIYGILPFAISRRIFCHPTDLDSRALSKAQSIYHSPLLPRFEPGSAA